MNVRVLSILVALALFCGFPEAPVAAQDYSFEKASYTKEPASYFALDSKEDLIKELAIDLQGKILTGSDLEAAKSLQYLLYLATDHPEVGINVGDSRIEELYDFSVGLLFESLNHRSSIIRRTAWDGVAEYFANATKSKTAKATQDFMLALRTPFATAIQEEDCFQLIIFDAINTFTLKSSLAFKQTFAAKAAKGKEIKTKQDQINAKRAEVVEKRAELAAEFDPMRITNLAEQLTQLTQEQSSLIVRIAELDNIIRVQPDDQASFDERTSKELRLNVVTAQIAELNRLSSSEVRLARQNQFLAEFRTLSAERDALELELKTLNGQLAKLDDNQKVHEEKNAAFRAFMSDIAPNVSRSLPRAALSSTNNNLQRFRLVLNGIAAFDTVDAKTVLGAVKIESIAGFGGPTSATSLPTAVSRPSKADGPGVSNTAPYDPAFDAGLRTNSPPYDVGGARKLRDDVTAGTPGVPGADSPPGLAPGATGAVATPIPDDPAGG